MVSFNPHIKYVGHFILYNFLDKLFLCADRAIVIIFKHLALSINVLKMLSTYFLVKMFGL